MLILTGHRGYQRRLDLDAALMAPIRLLQLPVLLNRSLELTSSIFQGLLTVSNKKVQFLAFTPKDSELVLNVPYNDVLGFHF